MIKEYYVLLLEKNVFSFSIIVMLSTFKNPSTIIWKSNWNVSYQDN